MVAVLSRILGFRNIETAEEIVQETLSDGAPGLVISRSAAQTRRVGSWWPPGTRPSITSGGSETG